MSTPAPDPITTGELGRRLTDLRQDVRQVNDRLSHLPDAQDLQNVGTAWQSALAGAERRIEIVAESDRRHAEREREALRARVKVVETWLSWGTRVVIGSVIAALLAYVLVSQPILFK